MGLLALVVKITPRRLRSGGSCRGGGLRGRSSSESLLCIGEGPLLLLVLGITICHSGGVDSVRGRREGCAGAILIALRLGSGPEGFSVQACVSFACNRSRRRNI